MQGISKVKNTNSRSPQTTMEINETITNAKIISMNNSSVIHNGKDPVLMVSNASMLTKEVGVHVTILKPH